jgi:hypothetical protein
MFEEQDSCHENDICYGCCTAAPPSQIKRIAQVKSGTRNPSDSATKCASGGQRVKGVPRQARTCNGPWVLRITCLQRLVEFDHDRASCRIDEANAAMNSYTNKVILSNHDGVPDE